MTTLNRRKFVYGAGAVLGSTLFGCGKQQAQVAGSGVTVFVNGTVLPVDGAFSVHEALAISGNRILAVGSRGDVLDAAGRGAQTVDLAGRVVLPGFIEPHMHFALMAGMGHWPDIGPFRYETTAEALAALKAIAADTPPDEWVAVRQFDPSLQEGPAMLTTRELDEVASDRPVFVLNASGHLAYGNSKLLEFGGIDAETPNPPGGEYFRYPDGSPNGAMSQVAYMPLLMRNKQLMRSLDEGFVDAGIRVGDEAAALGITTLCDQATGGIAGMGDLAFYRQMFDSGRMHSRVRASLYSARAAEWDEAGVAFGDGDALLRVAGWKIVTDGSNQGYTGRQREPYVGTDNVGIFYVQPDELKEMVLRRSRQGWPLVLHGNGDAGIDSILDAVQNAADSGVDVRKLRIRIEHCSILHDEQIERIRDLGIGPSFLINHVHYWGHAMRDKVFGPEKVQLLDRCKSVEDAGITWSMHTDAPVSPLGSLHKIRVAIARDLWKEPETVLAPDERVSVQAAIRAVTINAAWQCHSEHEIGSLEPGKLADFVVLESDPRAVEPTAISDIGVSETWMDGNRVFQG
jgi:predicted amidohydrolase YtcJ